MTLQLNPETKFTESDGKLTQDGFNAIRTALEAAGGTGATPGEGIIDEWSGNIARCADKTLTLIQKVSFAGTISETTTQCLSGTATFTFKVNGTAFSGTANDVSSTEQSQTHTTTFVADDLIAVTISANSSCLDAAFSIKYTRAVA